MESNKNSSAKVRAGKFGSNRPPARFAREAILISEYIQSNSITRDDLYDLGRILKALLFEIDKRRMQI